MRITGRWRKQRENGKTESICSVVTPNATHYEICKAFLEAGIHVACDKPLATDSAQGEELQRLAREKRPSVHGYLYLYGPCDGQVYPGSD